MATGPEMLINTLVKALKLEPEVDKIKAMIRQAIAEDLLGQAKRAIEKVEGFDERLARIEQRLGIEAGTSTGISDSGIRPVGDVIVQLKNGSDNA